MKATAVSAVVRRLATQGHLIAGLWRHSDAGGTYEHRYAATGRPQAVVGLAGERDVDDAVAAARAAQPAWGRLAPAKRAAVLFRLADLLEANAREAAELAALDNGTPVSAMNPGMHAAAWVRYYAGWCDKLDAGEFGGERGTAVRLEPYGVVAAIPPWNGSMMGMAQKCGPALASGNAVVAKPPEVSPFGMLRFAELALEAGLPEDVLNLVVGGVDAGAALVAHSGVDKVTFTGGTAAGRAIMASAALNITPVTLELGGKSPNIVFSDADLDGAAAMAAFVGTGLLSGQGCALPTRSYVHDDVYEQFLEKVVGAVASLVVGDPLDEGTYVGPVVTEAAADRIMAVITRAGKDGATLVTGGSRCGGELSQGYFVEPTVFGDVDHESDLARNEVFGPVHAVLRFNNDDEALAKANDNVLGLSAYVHTHDERRIERFTRELEAGTVVINGMGRNSPATPFGGTKQSGFGREGGRAGILEMVRSKAVHR